MANLNAGIPPQPYGAGGRKVTLPVKTTAQLYEGAMISQIAGACCTGTTAGAGDCIGVAEHDQLGGGADGASRVSLMTDKIFLFQVGTNPPTDATPYGTILFMADDHTVSLSGTAKAGRFVGMEDDGRARVFINGIVESNGSPSEYVEGTDLTDTAATTIQRVGRYSRYLLPGAMSQNETITLGTTGASKGDVLKVVRTSTSAFTTAFVNGGVGAGTLATIVASKIGWFQALFDGTNWIYDGSSAT